MTLISLEYLLLSLITPIILSFITFSSYNLKHGIIQLVKKYFYKTHSMVILEAIIDCSESERQCITTSMHCIYAILYFLKLNGTFDKFSEYNINCMAGDSNLEMNEYLKTLNIEFVPLLKIHHNGIEFIFIQEHISSEKNRVYIKWRAEMTSYTQNIDYIDNYIKKCNIIYTDFIYPISSRAQKMFIYIDSNTIRRFDFFSEKTFDRMFFKEKQSIITLLDKLEKGKLSKLGLLLYGKPGTGKTTLIKSIVNYTKRHIIYINLNTIDNMNDLMNIFFNPCIDHTNVPITNRIYIFEDIDCSGDLVYNRTMIKKDDDKSNNISFTSKLTMSDVLNCLDGIIELEKAIIIMTTNHIEKLDPALIRPGRINKCLELSDIDVESAIDMVKYYFKDCEITTKLVLELVDDICKKGITPSSLENIIIVCDTILELEIKLKEFLKCS